MPHRSPGAPARAQPNLPSGRREAVREGRPPGPGGRTGMDDEVMLAHPVDRVFSHLAEAARLADWLPEVSGVQAAVGSAPLNTGTGIGTGFGLRLRRNGHELPG